MVQLTDGLQVGPFLFVYIMFDGFTFKAVPQLEQLHNVLCTLLEDCQPIDVPCIEPDSLVPIHHQLSQEFEHHRDHLVVLVEGIEGTLHYGAEILRIEPVEEEVECLAVGHTSHDSSQDVEDLGDFLLCSLGAL